MKKIKPTPIKDLKQGSVLITNPDGDLIKKFIKREEVSIIIQALETAKKSYELIRDGSASPDVKSEMEKRIKTINRWYKKNDKDLV